MKQVSTLFDALRNEKFAIAVKDGHSVIHYGSDGAGREWAMWANSVDSKSLESSHLPAGVIQGPYKNINEIALKSLVNSFGYSQEISSSVFESKAYSYKSSYPVSNGSRVPAVMDTPITHFTTNQYTSAVNYKALTMRTQIKEGSFLLEARANNYAFNFDTFMYNATPSKAEIKSLRQRIDNNLGRSSERRLGLKLKSALFSTNERTKTGVIYELETKSLDSDIEFKNLGQRIGGGSRSMRRAARGAMARFDPKAWDGDGDGMVQEGTPFQRPAIPGVNDRASGGRVNAAAARQAWQSSQSRRASSGKPTREVLATPSSAKPQRTGLASSSSPRKQSDIDAETAKQITDSAKNVLSKKGTTTELRALIQGLGPDGATELTREQEDRLNSHIEDFEDGIYEDAEDFISDISNVLSGRQSGSQKLPQGGMRSRVSNARTQRQVNGLASRSSRAKKKSKFKGTPGRDRVDEKDGQLWDSLTSEQKDIVQKNAEQAYKDLMESIKTSNSDWWESFLSKTRRDKKRLSTDADGKEWSNDSRIAGEAITSLSLAAEDSLGEYETQVGYLERAIANASTPEEESKLQRKLDRLKKDFSKFQKSIDDLRTFDQMERTGDWSLLEHLHPETRVKAFGKKLTKKDKDKYGDVFGNSKPSMPLDEPSTIFEEVGGLRRAKARVGSKGDAKLADLARRVTRPNPLRAERRRLRKEGKGKTRTQDDARDKVSKIKRRISKARRDIKKNIRGKRDADQIQTDVNNARKANKTLLSRDKDNNPIADASTIERLQKLLIGYKPSENRRKDKSGKGKAVDSFLGQIWDSQGFSALPTAVSREEIEELIAQGWMPIQRGHSSTGNATKTRAMREAEEYIFDPLRYITGEGGENVGPGEYWAHPENSAWDEWIRKSADTGTIAVIPPGTKIISSDDAGKVKRDGDTIANAIDDYIKGAGSAGKAESLDPADLVREIKAHLAKSLPLDGAIWNTEIGKVYSQIFKLMEAGDSSEAKQLYNALKFMMKQRDSHKNIYAMILGYDGIDYGKGDGRLLIFNRASIAVMDNPTDLKEIKEVSSGVRKATPAKSKKPSRKGGTASTKVKGSSKSLDNQSWKQISEQGGSQPGGGFEDSSGKKFYVKKQKSQLHAENEVLMSKLYEKIGVRAAKNSGGTAHIKGHSPGPGVFSEWLVGSQDISSKHDQLIRDPKWKKSVQDTFVANAWLANWDATGNAANIKMGADGEAYIVDTGGGGLFRAKGDSKGSAFGPIVGEMESLRNPGLNSLGAAYFSDISPQEIARQVASIGALSDADIRQMVSDTISDNAEAKRLADILIARRDYLVQTWGTGSKK